MVFSYLLLCMSFMICSLYYYQPLTDLCVWLWFSRTCCSVWVSWFVPYITTNLWLIFACGYGFLVLVALYEFHDLFPILLPTFDWSLRVAMVFSYLLLCMSFMICSLYYYQPLTDLCVWLWFSRTCCSVWASWFVPYITTNLWLIFACGYGFLVLVALYELHDLFPILLPTFDWSLRVAMVFSYLLLCTSFMICSLYYYQPLTDLCEWLWFSRTCCSVWVSWFVPGISAWWEPVPVGAPPARVLILDFPAEVRGFADSPVRFPAPVLIVVDALLFHSIQLYHLGTEIIQVFSHFSNLYYCSYWKFVDSIIV